MGRFPSLFFLVASAVEHTPTQRPLGTFSLFFFWSHRRLNIPLRNHLLYNWMGFYLCMYVVRHEISQAGENEETIKKKKSEITNGVDPKEQVICLHTIYIFASCRTEINILSYTLLYERSR